MIAITGGSGKLGGLVIDRLLQKVSPDRLIAIVRNRQEARRLASRGVQVRSGDYSVPKTLASALAGAKRLLLISGSDIGKRVEQHRAVIEAAEAAGVEFIAYTSVLRAHTSTLPVASEHKATEEILRAMGIPSVILRNGWYIENYSENLATPLARGAFIGVAGNGRIAAAGRADYAAAAVTVLTTDGHIGKTYELAGDASFSMSELAASVSTLAGRRIGYRNLSVPEYKDVLMRSGLAAQWVEFFTQTDLSIARGDLDKSGNDLHSLINHDTQTLQEVLARLPRPMLERPEDVARNDRACER